MDAHARSWSLAIAEAEQARYQYDAVTDWLAYLSACFRHSGGCGRLGLHAGLSEGASRQAPWAGMGPLGGKVDPGEHPWAAARRELLGETGLDVQRDRTPAAAAARQFHADWSHTLALSYAAVVGETACAGEAGQPVQWLDLRSEWSTYFEDDHQRLVRHAEWLRQRGAHSA